MKNPPGYDHRLPKPPDTALAGCSVPAGAEDNYPEVVGTELILQGMIKPGGRQSLAARGVVRSVQLTGGRIGSGG